MNWKKCTLIIAFVLLLVLIGIPTWSLYREMRQERLDHALIEAIKAGDNNRTLEVLAEGANGEARDNQKSPTLQEAIHHLWNHFRHSGVAPSRQVTDDKHLPALLLLYCKNAESKKKSKDASPADLRVVRALLEHGAKVNDCSQQGIGSLFIAAANSDEDSVRFLIERGANIEPATNPDRQTPLMYADPESTKFLLEHGANIEARDAEKRTPLFYAVLGDRPDVVRILLEHRASVNVVDAGGDTPLVYAVQLGDFTTVRLLLEHRASTGAMDDTKITPLMYAVQRGDLVCARLLLEHGANVAAEDMLGCTALDAAEGTMPAAIQSQVPNARKMAALLRKYGEK